MSVHPSCDEDKAALTDKIGNPSKTGSGYFLRAFVGRPLSFMSTLSPRSQPSSLWADGKPPHKPGRADPHPSAFRMAGRWLRMSENRLLIDAAGNIRGALGIIARSDGKKFDLENEGGLGRNQHFGTLLRVARRGGL